MSNLCLVLMGKMTKCCMLMRWHHFLRGVAVIKPTGKRPIAGRTWTVTLENPPSVMNRLEPLLCAHSTTQHNQTINPFSFFLPQLLLCLKCSFKTGTKAKSKAMKWERHAVVGRAALTVAGQDYSFSSQWLVTDCHICYTLLFKKKEKKKTTKETNIKQ